MNEQPDPVCVCGKTSTGKCRRCGQEPRIEESPEYREFLERSLRYSRLVSEVFMPIWTSKCPKRRPTVNLLPRPSVYSCEPNLPSTTTSTERKKQTNDDDYADQGQYEGWRTTCPADFIVTYHDEPQSPLACPQSPRKPRRLGIWRIH